MNDKQRNAAADDAKLFDRLGIPRRSDGRPREGLLEAHTRWLRKRRQEYERQSLAQRAWEDAVDEYEPGGEW